MKVAARTFPLYSMVECSGCGVTFCWDVPRSIGGVCPECGGASLREGRDLFQEQLDQKVAALYGSAVYRRLSRRFVRAYRGYEKRAIWEQAKDAQARGELEARCLVCGRELTRPESVERLIGPECWEGVKPSLGFPHCE